MLREGESLIKLRLQLACLYSDLYQMAAHMPLAALESLCRKIHGIEHKLYSFNKGGRHGKEK